ncbi:hypothetical protein E2562_039009 [Oryza meyeriana var. granulata]|uniref:Uncharacterized protein n=1 Tax=Oryza meyeriana var. granulata TaxID=110450 RepID=A0A6G1C2I6_9ORYZ|nr:hypothetical protein E2562_039009 [Oryza meyeriana var. granulata]
MGLHVVAPTTEELVLLNPGKGKGGVPLGAIPEENTALHLLIATALLVKRVVSGPRHLAMPPTVSFVAAKPASPAKARLTHVDNMAVRW